MPQRMVGPLLLVLVLLVLAPAAPASAILACSSCHCGHSCLTTCGSPGTTCGTYGVCAGSPSCGGGGCLTAGDLKSFLDSLPADVTTPAPAAVQDRQAQVAARLTWRLAEQAELSGLGTVYGGGRAFRFQGPRGQALTADIALVSTTAGGTRIPDLVVELAGAPGFRSNADRWLRAGSSAVLVVDAVAGTVSIHRGRNEVKSLGADDLLEIPDLLPGWSLRVADLFE